MQDSVQGNIKVEKTRRPPGVGKVKTLKPRPEGEI